jgi:hypothetical protein
MALALIQPLIMRALTRSRAQNRNAAVARGQPD